jgi:hypothetical protein
MAGKFELGKIIVKDEALYALTLAGQDAAFFLEKHASGDCGYDRPERNKQGLQERSMVMSRYRTLLGQEIFVITFLADQETYLFCPPNAIIRDFPLYYAARPRQPEEKGPYDPTPPNPIAMFQYDSISGRVPAMVDPLGVRLYDLPGIVKVTYDPGPVAKLDNSAATFIYDSNNGRIPSEPPPGPVPQPGPILKASPYYYGPSAERKAEPGEPKEDEP